MAGNPGGISFSREERVMGVLLGLVVLTLVAAHFGWPSWLQFFLSVGAIIPLAAFIGSATEALADRLGGKTGGLLNATFGNSPDLLVGVFGVQRGLIPLVKATLIGALMSNSALVMGLCYIVAGLRYRSPRFDRREAGHHSVLMLLTVAAFVFPSVGAIVLCGPNGCNPHGGRTIIMHVSVGVAIVLLVSYLCYVVYGIFGFESIGTVTNGRETRAAERAVDEEETHHNWPVWMSVLVLALATIALIPITDILTGSVDPVTSVLGWTQVFVGMVIVANAGNVAEAYAALRLTWRHGGDDPDRGDSGLDLALGIASASSIQIATFVAPLIVLYSLVGHNMTLVFSPVELAIFAVMVVVFAFIAIDGESNWLEGAQLVALYAMAAIVFYAFPVSVFGG